LHLHPFVAAYLTSGFPSIRASWYFKHKKWVRIVPRDAYLYLEFRFLDQNRRLLRTK
jgi:ribonuclease G